MALVFLLAVLLFVVLAIVAFVFPPSKWVRVQGGKKSAGGAGTSAGGGTMDKK